MTCANFQKCSQVIPRKKSTPSPPPYELISHSYSSVKLVCLKFITSERDGNNTGPDGLHATGPFSENPPGSQGQGAKKEEGFSIRGRRGAWFPCGISLGHPRGTRARGGGGRGRWRGRQPHVRDEQGVPRSRPSWRCGWPSCMRCAVVAFWVCVGWKIGALCCFSSLVHVRRW